MKSTAALMVMALVSLVAGYAWFAAPCEVWKFSAGKDVPARCLMGDPK